MKSQNSYLAGILLASAIIFIPSELLTQEQKADYSATDLAKQSPTLYALFFLKVNQGSPSFTWPREPIP